MLPRKHVLFLGALLLLLSLAVAACSETPEAVETEVTREVEVEVTRIVEQEVEVEVPGDCPEVEPCPEPEEPAVSVIPFEALWLSSGHADATAEAFVHWDEDDPAEVPTSCAKCHSTPGYLDYIGADGSEAGVVDAPAPIGTTVECQACHNAVTVDKDSVMMPSGVTLTSLGAEARCMECHQGRHSKVSVDASIADAGLGEGDDDTISEDLGFSNIHYYAAAATQFGTLAMGGYEYDGKTYDGRFEHVEGYDSCIDCHNAHTLEVELEECASCHEGLETTEDLLDVRMIGSLQDYDGDGDFDEGIYWEIEGLRDILYASMQMYSAEVTGSPIVYSAGAYPYFFNDTNADGEAGDDEANFGNRYATWTPRLAKAAYNYQVSLKDPGRFAHGGKYMIQLIYDSIEDLNAAISMPVDMTTLQRIDFGHFAGSEEAFRHWDEDGEVPGRCSRCHSSEGLPLFMTQGVEINQPLSNGFTCETCHSNLEDYAIYNNDSVTFPSGASVSFGESDVASNLCITCHQGRAAGSTVAAAIGDADGDTVTEGLRFINIHYFPAGVSLFGADAAGAYQFPGKEYVGQFEHVGAFNSCAECHNIHSQQVEVAECADCHETVETREDLAAIRVNEVDFDGDGDATEGLAAEIQHLEEDLYAVMQSYSAEVIGSTIVYNPSRYPYFFDEAGESWGTWTPNLLAAAYNYQYVHKDPGAYAHGGAYAIQVTIDSIEALGGDISAYTRP